jgi:trehalose synthase-fused probable maltokinase
MHDDRAILGKHGNLDEALTAAYLREQRWFGAQTREISGVELIDEVAIADGMLIALADVYFSGGGRALYQLLLAAHDDDTVDASGMPDFARRTLERVARSDASDGRDGKLTFKAIRSIGALESCEVRSMGDQSNTSVAVGDLLLKVYRRIDAGVNPELDILLYFAEHGFEHVPGLAGWYAYAGTHVDATMGIVQHFVAGAIDGWQLGLEQGASQPAAFNARLRRLGDVIGRMHSVLAADTADPAFMPEDTTPESTGLVTARIDEEIDTVFDEFGEREELEPLIGRRDDAHALVASLSVGSSPGRMIRTHGDLHLGQLLWADDDWLVIDFEGEPARPASARRQKNFPLRDVAGLLRSVSYLSAFLERAGHELPQGWCDDAREQLLDGYRASAPATVLPPSVEGQERQLSLFELEKAFYELRYELDNRPDSVTIPVQGILGLFERATA